MNAGVIVGLALMVFGSGMLVGGWLADRDHRREARKRGEVQ